MRAFMKFARLPAAAAASGAWWHFSTSASVQSAGSTKGTEVFSWGSATYGETGHGHESTGEAVPTRVEALSKHHIVAISTAASGVSSAALTSDGNIYTWGCGRDARLGHGDAGSQNQLTPRLVEGLSGVQAVSMGEFLGLALTSDGKVFSFGRRAVGHEFGKQGTPHLVNGLDGVRITAVSCGREHSLAIDADGNVYGWGINTSHALGTGNKDEVKKATKIAALAGKRVVALSAGREHSLFLTENGEVYACGTEFFGQCGQAMSVPYVKTPVRVTGELAGKKVSKIACGEYHSIAICDDGSVYSWGFNRDGTLGHGDRSDVGTPRLLEADLAAGRVVQAAGGGGHTLFLTHKNGVFAVGRGRSGQLGRGGGLESVAAYRTTPVAVGTFGMGADRVVSVAAGRDHSMVLVEKLN